MNGRWRTQEGVIPFVVVGVAALGGVLGLAWAGQEWAQGLLREAGGELTVWVLRGAFWAVDLVALQAASDPVNRDWYTPVLQGPALPIYALAALVTVATLIAEVIAAMVAGNTTRTVQAVFRALVAGMLASAGASLLLAVGGAVSKVGRIALEASGTSVDAPLVPLQEALMDAALGRESGAELFIVFLAGVVVVFTALAIYFTLALRPVVLAALIVFLPVAHALSVWTPLRRVQLRAWAVAFAVLLADAAVLTMIAVTNTVVGQPQGVDRLIFGTFGLLLAALAPAALARIVATPELHTAVQAMSRGSQVVAVGAGVAAAKGVLFAGGLPRPTPAAPAGPTVPSGGALTSAATSGPGSSGAGGGGSDGADGARSRGGPPAGGGGPGGSATSALTSTPTPTTAGGSADRSPASPATTPPRSPGGGWQSAVNRPPQGGAHG